MGHLVQRIRTAVTLRFARLIGLATAINVVICLVRWSLGLADALREKRKMTREDLLPYLKRMILQEGFPRPYGQFEQFSDKPLETGAAASQQ